MPILYRAVMLSCFITLIGCDGRSVPERAKIQVNIPAEPYPGTRTKTVTLDVTDDRSGFVDLWNSKERIGMCNPRKIEEANSAYQVMTVSYWGKAVGDRKTFFILKKQNGEWITSGYGGVEIYDHPQGFPEYRYSESALAEIQTWYEKNVPPGDRKR